jgi:hypothetical protein
MNHIEPGQNGFIIGHSGAGKHVFATQRIVDNLAAGRTVIVLDRGASYLGLVKCLGGTSVKVQSRDHHTIQKFGTMPFMVFDLEDLDAPLTVAQLHLPPLEDGTFVLVDETYYVAGLATDLWDTLKAAMARGVTVTAVLQDIADVAEDARPAGMAIQLVQNGALVHQGTLQRGQLYRHQDGGIYQFDYISKSTEDLSELVNYSHVWPFEAGVKWSRPAREWPSRFTPITAADLAEARKADRLDAQAAVKTAKAARRAAGK